MGDSKNTSRRVQREVLPIPDQPYAGFVAYDAKDPDSKFAPIEELRPPEGAPNRNRDVRTRLWVAPGAKYMKKGLDGASNRCWRTQSIARSVMSIMKW